MTKTAKQLQAEFNKFHKENPHVYKKIVQMTRDLKAQGHKKIGMQMIFEVLRWRSMMRTTGIDYKLSNSHVAYYSRLIMAQEPDLEDIYTTRESKAEIHERLSSQPPKAVSWLNED
jgi:hypothetical protein